MPITNKESLYYKNHFENEVKKHENTKIEKEKIENSLKTVQSGVDDLNSKFLDGNTGISLFLANNFRNDIEIELKDEKQLTWELQENIKEGENMLVNLRFQIEKQETHISSLERDLDTKDIKIDSIEKQYTLKIEQLNERNSQFQQLLVKERENKELWVSKFEKELKQNSENSNQLLNIQSVIKDFELKLKDAEIKYETLENTNKYLKEVISIPYLFVDQ